MNIFNWIKNKRDLEEELEQQDIEIDKLKSAISKYKIECSELNIEKEYLEEQNTKYIERIKELRKENKRLKEEIKNGIMD